MDRINKKEHKTSIRKINIRIVQTMFKNQQSVIGWMTEGRMYTYFFRELSNNPKWRDLIPELRTPSITLEVYFIMIYAN